MERVETVTISRPDLPGGKLIINKADFDPATMQLYFDIPPIQKAEEKPQSRKKETRK